MTFEPRRPATGSRPSVCNQDQVNYLVIVENSWERSEGDTL